MILAEPFFSIRHINEFIHVNDREDDPEGFSLRSKNEFIKNMRTAIHLNGSLAIGEALNQSSFIALPRIDLHFDSIFLPSVSSSSLGFMGSLGVHSRHPLLS
jgi:hypothetical protein